MIQFPGVAVAHRDPGVAGGVPVGVADVGQPEPGLDEDEAVRARLGQQAVVDGGHGGPDGEPLAGWPAISRARSEVPELGADLISLRSAEVFQDREGLFPERARLLRSPGGVAGVAEVA